jgi:hypothetical protein
MLFAGSFLIFLSTSISQVVIRFFAYPHLLYLLRLPIWSPEGERIQPPTVRRDEEQIFFPTQ